MSFPTTHPELDPLPLPLHRKRRHQILQCQVRRLLARKNGFHDVQRQQRQPHHTTHKRRPDLLRPGDLLRASVGSVFQQLLPPKCSSNRLDHRVVDGSHWRRAALCPIRQYDPITLRPPRSLKVIGRSMEMTSLSNTQPSSLALPTGSVPSSPPSSCQCAGLSD